MLRLIANVLLLAWIWFAFAHPFPLDGLLIKGKPWVVNTHQLLVQLVLYIFAAGIINFGMFPIDKARWTKKYARYLVGRPLVWMLICVGLYGGSLPYHSPMLAKTISTVMEIRKYTVQSKREISMQTNSPYSLFGLVPFRYYQYVYSSDVAEK